MKYTLDGKLSYINEFYGDCMCVCINEEMSGPAAVCWPGLGLQAVWVCQGVCLGLPGGSVWVCQCVRLCS
jgi:hypothetical protein